MTTNRHRTRRALAAACTLLAAASAGAATLKATLISPEDDPRLDKTRLERAYLGHAGGPALDGVQVALEEGQFELEAAGSAIELKDVAAASPAAAKAAAVAAEKAGAAVLLTDLPADWTVAVADAVKIPVLNVGNPADSLRQQDCRPRLYHLIPSERMRADALAQSLVSRKWSKLLLLVGPSPQDQQRAATAQASIKRYGLQVVASKPFKLSGDPRERDFANPLLLTASTTYDVVWVVDSDGEFARTMPYRTVLPRPVVGDAGLVPVAWHAQFERYGAPQVSKRFAKAAHRAMTGEDWSAWLAGKTLIALATAVPKGPAAAWAQALPKTVVDGSKGTSLSFRAWDGQLRQTMLMTDGQGVISQAPIEGLLHPSNVLDTLGADAPEKTLQGHPMKAEALVPVVSSETAARRGMAHALQAMQAIVTRELYKFSQQTGRLVSALVRPLLWLAVFAAGFRNVFGVAIVEPYDTYIPYDVYIVPGLVGMVLLFNGMQSSLAMVYDREMGLMRLLLTAPLPRPWLLFSKLVATAVLSVLQALAFVIVAALIGTTVPAFSLDGLHALIALVAGALMLGSLGLLLSVHIKQLENFAGTMNFVIFPMYFLSTALYPLWKLQESGAEWVYQLARFNPFTYAIEWIRFALYGKDPGIAPWVVLGCGAAFFIVACWGYDPQRGFGGLTKRGGGGS